MSFIEARVEDLTSQLSQLDPGVVGPYSKLQSAITSLESNAARGYMRRSKPLSLDDFSAVLPVGQRFITVRPFAENMIRAKENSLYRTVRVVDLLDGPIFRSHRLGLPASWVGGDLRVSQFELDLDHGWVHEYILGQTMDRAYLPVEHSDLTP